MGGPRTLDETMGVSSVIRLPAFTFGPLFFFGGWVAPIPRLSFSRSKTLSFRTTMVSSSPGSLFAPGHLFNTWCGSRGRGILHGNHLINSQVAIASATCTRGLADSHLGLLLFDGSQTSISLRSFSMLFLNYGRLTQVCCIRNLMSLLIVASMTAGEKWLPRLSPIKTFGLGYFSMNSKKHSKNQLSNVRQSDHPLVVEWQTIIAHIATLA